LPYAVTLRLDTDAAAPVEAMWRALAAHGVADDGLRLGYPPHVTLAVLPDDAPSDALDAAVAALAGRWHALPVTLAGFGVFPGPPACLWILPVPDAALLARHADTLAALPGLDCDRHYRAGAWVPHVTLAAAASSPARALEVLTPLWRGPVPGLLDRLDLVRFRPVEVLRSHPLPFSYTTS
jgi:2'-5' RNA ligase